MPWLAALGSAAGAAGSALGAGAGSALSGIGSALGSAGSALGSGGLGGIMQTGANALSQSLGGALGSMGGELGAGGMGPATGASGFLGGLGQTMGGMGVANPSLGSTLGQLTGAGLQMRQGNRMGGLQSLASMTGMAGPATRQNTIAGQQPQQHKGLLSGLLSG